MTVVLHRLSNGLRVAVEPMPGLRSASVGVYVTVFIVAAGHLSKDRRWTTP